MKVASRWELLAGNRTFQVCLIILLIIVALGVVGPLLTRSPDESAGGKFEPPSSEFLLGTDAFGRDVFAQLCAGIRNSLMVASLAGLIAIVIGVVMGAVSGFKGGLIDEGLNTFTNVFMVLPVIIILILVGALLEQRSMVVVALLIGVFSWPWTARAIRSQVMSLKERKFVDLARISGKGDFAIALKEILPNMMAYVFMCFAIQLGSAIVAEAGISMIGLGPSNVTTLGTMLNWSIQSQAVSLGIWWWFVPPGVVIMITTGTIMMASSVIDDVFNPKLRER